MATRKNKSWTLRQQLLAIIIAATVSMLLLGGLSIWRIRQFNHRDHELHLATLALQENLKNNFSNTRLLGEIDADLRLYMRSGNKNALNRIQINIKTLYNTLSKKKQGQLQAFQKKLQILQIRMDSLRENDETIFQTERNIVLTSRQLLQTSGSKFFFQIHDITSEAFLKHHHLYNTTILTAEPDNLQRATQEYEELFDTLESKLEKITLQLAPDQQQYAKELQQYFYELDETVSTINSIRTVTLEAKADIEHMIVAIKTDIAASSIAQAKESSSTMSSVLGLARNNLILMAISLVVAAFLLALTAFLLNQSMVKPLLAFSEMLQRMTRILTGLRIQNEFENESSDLFTSLTNNRQDEIGQVASAIGTLLMRLRELAIFRQAVEADETSDEIYQRLSRTFNDRLNLRNFIFFELSENTQEMTPNLKHFEKDFQKVPETSLNEECRARRIGTIISSFSDPHTCSLFPMATQLRYFCIPMQVSGMMIGVVQFLFPSDINKEQQKDILQALTEARHYIAEALPVLHAKRLAKRLEIMATEDQLTGLYNRHYLENTLDRLTAGTKRRNTKICTLMCDLDHFKDVNDSYGHDAGDRVLMQLAKILLNAVRDADLVIRFGGEEFMILLVDCDPATSKEMAERIRKEVQLYKFHIPGHTIRMTMSIGLSNFPDPPDQDIWNAFKLADIALYRAKEEGRNRVIQFNNNMLSSSHQTQKTKKKTLDEKSKEDK